MAKKVQTMYCGKVAVEVIMDCDEKTEKEILEELARANIRKR